jgi:hypothetical protein
MLYNPRKRYRLAHRKSNFGGDMFSRENIKRALLVTGVLFVTYYIGKLAGALSGFVAGIKAAESSRPSLESETRTQTSNDARVIARVNSKTGPGFLYIDDVPVGIIAGAPETSVVSVPKSGTYVLRVQYPDGRSSDPKQIEISYFNAHNKKIVHSLEAKT